MRAIFPKAFVASLLAAFVPGVAAAVEPSCAVGADAGATELDDFYIRRYTRMGSPVVELWQETNGIAGLQISDHTCADGSHYESDTRIVGLSGNQPASGIPI